MRDVLTTPMFAPAAPILGNHAAAIKESDMVHITGPASLEGVLAIGQLEAACLDLGVKYRRRFFTPRHHLCLLYTSPSPRDKRQSRMPSSA